MLISIHALREEGDLSGLAGRHAADISIHALREEGDLAAIEAGKAAYQNFYPRPPRGGRRKGIAHRGGVGEFLSTPSARRATRAVQEGKARHQDFYPRPPRGGRRDGLPAGEQPGVFLSTPSARRATVALVSLAGAIAISIHALREEGDISRSKMSWV